MRIRNIISGLMLLLVAGVMLVLSWQKWPDVLIDFGRELYVPWQLSKGAVLYKDIAYLNGPWAAYFNSLVFSWFGRGLFNIALVNLSVIGLITWFIYYFFKRFTNWTTALACGLVFLTMFAFSQYIETANYNFVCPYSHDLTHGILFSFCAIFVFLKYLKKQKPVKLIIMGVFTGVVFLTKMEVFLALAISLFTGLMITAKRRFPATLIFIGGFLLPVSGFIIFLSLYMPVGKVGVSLLFAYTTLVKSAVVSSQFYRIIGGTDLLFSNLIALARTALLLGLILFSFGCISYLLGRLNARLRNAAIAGLGLIIILLLPKIVNNIFWWEIGRVLPLVSIGLIVYLSKRLQASKGLFVFTLFGLLLLLKMIFNAHIFHYGFALALPAALVFVSVLLFYVPFALDKIFKNKHTIGLFTWGLVLLIMISHLMLTYLIYLPKTYPIGWGKDLILTKPSQKNRIISRTLAKIDQFQARDTFVVFPDGIMMNYLSERNSSVGYTNFMPSELEMFAEEKILNSLRKNPPDYVILVDIDTSEYGAACFGKDYARNIFSWIKSSYEPVDQFGQTPFIGKGFGVIIAKQIR